MMRSAAFSSGLIGLLFVACSTSESSSSSGRWMSGEVIQGIATFYDADGTGNCSFPKSNASPLLVVAPNKDRWYNGSAACGSCLEVTGSLGTVVVEVVDSCPTNTAEMDCGKSKADLDLSPAAFAAIANPDDGKVPVTFQVVPCDVTGPMQYVFKKDSSEYWTAIQVRNHREPIATVEYSDNGGNWVMTSRSDDNYFTVDKGVGPHPNGLPLRITDAYGQVVVDTVPVVVNENAIDSSKVFTGTQQFE